MAELYGTRLTRRDLRERMGLLSQVAGVRLMELADGTERGIRILEFRTGSGLRFTALIDRALDIADCEYKGQGIAWHSPSGFRHPALHDYEGEEGLAFTRSFSGLLVTCGLDHTGVPQTVDASNYNYPGRRTVRHSLHGRVGTIPATLSGYGETWDGEHCVLWAEGVVRQSTNFGEDLHLHRRIEADLGGIEIRIRDRVVNHGFNPTPHMFFYHVNLGYPLLDEGARYLAPVRDVVWASHAGERYRAQGVGWNRMGAPAAPFREQVWQHELGVDDEGEVPVALVNDRLGLGFEVVTRKNQLPCFYEWQNFQSGMYAVGIEPSTHHVLGDLAARERGEMIWLEHGEERRYDAAFRVLDGPEAIGSAEARIDAIAKAPQDGFAEPSSRFAPLREKGRR
ncbi:aldose 1-epimerase family protein [Aureimonas sp. AU4]|uniref:aldose 1-epimerase family protein n=1 Tax=Aureimonas sp. AU4 TaxID=1638163 RepID=UPI0007804B6C|nr:aldose 1-epimerase family protein [Aureimonas sp. AU4]